jgi:hypothetical protein
MSYAIMSYAAHRKDFAPYLAKLEPRDNCPAVKAGFWQRLLMAMSSAQQNRAERRTARFIQDRGGYLTDEIERELMRHMTASPHYWGMHL